MNYKEKYTKYKNKYIGLRRQIGIKYLDCNNIKKLTKKEMNDKQQQAYDYLLENVFDEENFTVFKSKHVKKTFKILDKIYFKRKISKYIKDFNIDLKFVVSGKLTKTAGVCKYKYLTSGEKKYTIGISSVILNSLFTKGEKSLKINGLPCKNRLECFLSIFEHELTHLIIFLFCPELGEKKGGHTSTFMKIVNNLYGHTEYKHMLLCGDYETMKGDIEKIKTNIEIGDYVISKKINNKVYEGLATRINPKSITILLENGKKFNIYYPAIDKIQKKKGVEKKLLKKAKVDVQSMLKIGDKIKVKIKGSIVTGTVIKLNPTRAKIKLDTGEVWNVPYHLILL
uniref:SprT-like family protein n=1 Tax=Mimivirus LCMiAC01 TaxID=2506608 RepID=A0A481Z0X7_9VIRU|nr:MAG: SprT-like family protein [Mimivirus LCMiAC01]